MSEEEYARVTTRRNALTPESDQIEPIKQTEIQERMSSLAVSSCGGASSSSSGCGSGETSYQLDRGHSSKSGQQPPPDDDDEKG